MNNISSNKNDKGQINDVERIGYWRYLISQVSFSKTNNSTFCI
jgi:hypothetical protein